MVSSPNYYNAHAKMAIAAMPDHRVRPPVPATLTVIGRFWRNEKYNCLQGATLHVSPQRPLPRYLHIQPSTNQAIFWQQLAARIPTSLLPRLPSPPSSLCLHCMMARGQQKAQSQAKAYVLPPYAARCHGRPNVLLLTACVADML